MLKVSKQQKSRILKLTNNGQQAWTMKKLLKAIKIVYGNRIKVIRKIGNFKGENTRFQLVCNLCGYGLSKDGTRWTASARTLLYHPSCPRCMFKGKCHKLGYLVVQKRLDKQHRHIKITPVNHNLYKNQSTKVIAYDYVNHERWITTINNVLHGRNAPRHSHKLGYKKEAVKRSFSYYKKQVIQKWSNQVDVKKIGAFHSKQKSKVKAINRKDGFSWITNMEELLSIKNPKTRPKLKRKQKEPIKQMKKLQKNIRLKHLSQVNDSILPMRVHKLVLQQYNHHHVSYRCKQLRKKFLKWYHSQKDIRIPQIKRIINRFYSTHMKIHCICLHCGYGSKGEWIESIDSLMGQGVGCPNCNTMKYHGERAIGQYLEVHGFNKQKKNYILPQRNMTYIHRYIFKHCIYKSHLHADIILKYHNQYIVLEYNGAQHYNSYKFFGGTSRLHLQIKRDKYKKEYCKNKKNWHMISIKNSKNINRLSYVRHLVHTTLDQQLLPLLHKYSHSTSTQLSLF